MIRLQIKITLNNDCDICYNNETEDLKGCPQCLNLMCLNCYNNVYDVNN